MYLPEPVLTCLNALEHAGFAAYAVGGCVRDACLGQQAQDFDLCTAALPEQIQQIFAGHRLVLAGVKHGTGHLDGHQSVRPGTGAPAGIPADANTHPRGCIPCICLSRFLRA